MYQGWIVACGPSEVTMEERGQHLERLGVRLGTFDGKDTWDNCVVSDDAMDALDPWWGPYIWGLFPPDESRERK